MATEASTFMNENNTQRNKKAWPTKDAMEQVYKMKLWGGDTDFYSGEGSHNPEIINPYIEAVTTFLSSFEKPVSVCDLGCGDFNVGKNLVEYTNKYIAVDIVEDLIERNKQKYKLRNLEFLCLDIAKDNLPSADCAILRQVLQHLSNAEVKAVVGKLKNYKYIILTEHLPNGEFMPNKDIISGQGIRINSQSGLNLLVDPFNLKVAEEKQLSAISLKDNKGVILTSLYTLF